MQGLESTSSDMTVFLLVLAGVAGGLCGSVAGLASIVTYPALLAAGLAPLQANVTNTVALVFTSIGSVSASRTELAGQRAKITPLAVIAVAGGAVGGLVLLLAPADSFEVVVPVLVGLASLAVLAPRPHSHVHGDRPEPRWLRPAVFANGVYSGYFGAASGVMLLATLLAGWVESFPRVNAAKSLIAGLGNAMGAVVFVVAGHVDWQLGIPLAIGLFVGGRLGPWVVRHSSPTILRYVIAAAGVGLAVKLGIDAY